MIKIILGIFLSVTIYSKGDDLTATNILQKSKEAYESLKYYQSSGVVSAHVNGSTIPTEFVVKLIPPYSYQIMWRLKVPGVSQFKQTGAVWNSDGDAYLYMSMINSYSKLETDYMALSAATGISNGAAFTIPALALDTFSSQPSPFSQLINPKLVKKESVFGEECYLVSGSTQSSKEVSYWFSVESFLLRKIRRSYEKNHTAKKIPKDVSNEEIKSMLKELGQEISEEKIKAMKELLKKSTILIDIKGFSEETHNKISLAPLTKEDLSYKVPRGAILKKSLFENMFQKLPKHNHPHTYPKK
ncbi:MAG: hypothetical protein MK132_24820 [Lentisphaerales bacterium]|nr:hypothetical protein [Lentisphaerales bacterium]